MDILNLLTRLLLWIGIGYFLWWLLSKLISPKLLTWFGGAIILALIAGAFLFPEDSTIGVFWQFLRFPLTPLGGAITLLLMALSNGLKKTSGRMVLAALLILIIASMPIVARTLINQSESAVQLAYQNQRRLCLDLCPAVDQQVPVDRAVSIVVVGDNVDADRLTNSLNSRVDADNPLSPVLVARLNSAANIYDRIRLAQPFVTVTAGARSGSAEEREQLNQFIRQQLVSRGVPTDRIRIQATGSDIRGAVNDQRNFLREQGLFTDPPRNGIGSPEIGNRDANRVVLVARALTMRRAALAFEGEGLHVVAAPTELYSTLDASGRGRMARLADLVPTVDALMLTTPYWEELLISIYYYLRGWMPSFNVGWNQVVETL